MRKRRRPRDGRSRFVRSVESGDVPARICRARRAH